MRLWPNASLRVEKKCRRPIRYTYRVSHRVPQGKMSGVSNQSQPSQVRDLMAHPDTPITGCSPLLVYSQCGNQVRTQHEYVVYATCDMFRPSPPTTTAATRVTSHSRSCRSCQRRTSILGGAATCSEGLVLLTVGLYCSCPASQASKGNF